MRVDQWEACNWSCDLRANERPQKKLPKCPMWHMACQSPSLQSKPSVPSRQPNYSARILWWWLVDPVIAWFPACPMAYGLSRADSLWPIGAATSVNILTDDFIICARPSSNSCHIPLTKSHSVGHSWYSTGLDWEPLHSLLYWHSSTALQTANCT